MNNFPVIHEGKEYWISRAIAAVVIVFAYNKHNEKCVLAVNRGKGTPDPEFIGKYCLPCGYLDYNETIVQAAARELKEETGLTFSNNDFKLVHINDIPQSDKRQNVSFIYTLNTNILVEDLEKQFTTANSEKDEVSSIRFIVTEDIELYEWAFNHDKLIKEYVPKI